MSNQKSFVFYLNWEVQLLKMNLEERWSFVHNLIKYHDNREITFVTDREEMAWLGVLPALETNQKKWNAKAENSRENGKKNTGKKSNNKNESNPPSSEPRITHQVILEPTEPVKSKELIVNSKVSSVKGQESSDKFQGLIVESEEENINSQVSSVNSEQLSTNSGNNSTKSSSSGMLMSDFYRDKIYEIETKILSSYNNAEDIIQYATTDNLREFVDNKIQYDELFPLVKKYRECLKYLHG